MKISPLDIKKQEFAVKFRGYTPEEVHSYLEMVADELEQVLRKNLELEQKIENLQDRLDHYKRMENVLQETLVTTQRSAEDTKASAEKMSQTIIAEAKLEAQRISKETSEKLALVRREIADLYAQRDTFIISFKAFLDSQMSMIEMIEKKAEMSGELMPRRKKADLSDEELEKIVTEFEKKIGLEGGDRGQSPRET